MTGNIEGFETDIWINYIYSKTCLIWPSKETAKYGHI